MGVFFCIMWLIFSCIAKSVNLSKLVLILFACFAFLISCFFMKFDKRCSFKTLAYICYALGSLGALHQKQQNQFGHWF